MTHTPAPVQHAVLAGVAVVWRALNDMAPAHVWSLSDTELATAVDEIHAIEGRLAALKLALVADADGRNVGAANATTTAGWLRGRLLLGPGEAGRAVKLGLALRDDCTATGQAQSDGARTVEQARVITTAMANLPPVEAEVRVRAEEFLIDQAATLDPMLLRRAAEALTETLTTAPDTDERLRRDVARRELGAVPTCDGMVRVSGWFDRGGWAEITAALDPLAAPSAAADGRPDPRSPGRRRADALVDMARLAAGATMPAGGAPPPTMNVTIDLDALTGQLHQAGRLNTGEPISATAARRIGCDATVIPAVLGAAGQVLDIGRAARTIPPAIRRALVVRDEACAMPGCDRLAAWCQGHHILHWAAGGETALANLVLLCHDHHHAVHHDGWAVTIDEDGLPTFRPPPWINPDQPVRRHHRYFLRRLDYDLGGRDPTG